MSCIDFNSTTERDILDYLESDRNNIVICIENLNNENSKFNDDLNFRCGKRDFINASGISLSDNGKTYYEIYENLYVCPMDLLTLKNKNYSFYNFQYLRPVSANNNLHIYNVKKYTIDDYNDSI